MELTLFSLPIQIKCSFSGGFPRVTSPEILILFYFKEKWIFNIFFHVSLHTVGWPNILITLELFHFSIKSLTVTFHPRQLGWLVTLYPAQIALLINFFIKPPLLCDSCTASSQTISTCAWNTHNHTQFLPHNRNANTFIYFSQISTSHFSHGPITTLSLHRDDSKNILFFLIKLPEQMWRRKEGDSCVSELKLDERVQHKS